MESTQVGSLPNIALPLSPPQATLTRKAIYQKIDDIICKILTTKGTATGFCLGKNLISVPFHILELNEIGKTSDGKTAYNIEKINCLYQGVRYEAKWATPNLDTAYALDCAIFEIEDQDFDSIQSLQLFTDEVEPGEEVYYGGFPLTQEDPTFHSGIVSSVSQQNEKSFFTIDGTVVPGNSGGPVFVLQENMLKLIGIITSQIADLSPEDQKIFNIMKVIKNDMDKNPIPHQSGHSLGRHGLTTLITLTTPQGKEEILINDRKLICLSFDLFQRNLSTGIGKVLSSKHLIDVCDGVSVTKVSQPSHAVPVMHHERMPGMLSVDINYRRWYHRHVKGQALFGQLFGDQLSAAGHITAKEEKILWDYYQSQPHFKGFKEPTQDELTRLSSKFSVRNKKSLKNNSESWIKKLKELKTKSPELIPAIKQAFSELNKALSDVGLPTSKDADLINTNSEASIDIDLVETTNSVEITVVEQDKVG